jgi:uncharacterized protein
MKFFALITSDVSGAAGIRAAKKDLHRMHLDSASGTLAVLQSGPLLDAGGSEIGSLIIFKAESAAQIKIFMDDDPYTKAGLVKDRRIQEWFWRRGNPYLNDGL